MPLDDDLHNELSGFTPEVIAILEAGGFWDIEGEFDPAEFIADIPKRAKDNYKKESEKKNSRVWGLVNAVLIGEAIGAGIDQFKQAYPRKVAPKNPKDYADRYIKEHGGEFIKGMSRTDQKKLVGFIWSNAGQNERPMKKLLLQQPHLKYLLDSGNHRAETITRTEKFRATTIGTHMSAQDAGFTKKTWHTAGDRRVRPSHRMMNGLTIATIWQS